MRSFSARQSREHNDANVIGLGERVAGPGLALGSIHRFLAPELSGAERHRRRLGKILALEAAFGAPQGD
jgi:ribose 5-phosphate isomerase B